MPSTAWNLRVCFALFAVGSLLCARDAVAEEEKPRIVSVTKIWDQGPHNAFTDLIRFQDRWYCTFRESDGHVGGDGRIRIIMSEDGAQWESAALLVDQGTDLRDPKLSIMPNGRLMMLAGGSLYEGQTYLGRQTRVAFSADGTAWSAPQRILSAGEWLWRVTWHEGRGYGVTRHLSFEGDKKRTLVRLVVTEDGLHYDEVVKWGELHDRPNETTLRFLEGGEMMAMVRREEGDRTGWLGTSKAPYTEWAWHQTEYRFGGPNFIRLPNGELWGGSRDYRGGTSTVLAKMGRESYEPVLTLPSGGDTSYPGLVWHEGLLWMSYYSSHEGKTSIYLAKISLAD